MFRKIFVISFLLAYLIYVPKGNAQEVDDSLVHANETGVNFALGMSGFGFGGFYRKALGSYTYVGVNLNFFIMRDDKEFEYFDPILGIPRKANDVNRLFFIPLNLEFKKRLFAEDIEDNFRPHFIVQGGLIYGVNFPKPDQLKDESQFSYNFVLGIGADITNKDRYFITIRPQYRFVYFREEIAQKKNHSNFEIKIEIGGRLF